MVQFLGSTSFLSKSKVYYFHYSIFTNHHIAWPNIPMENS